jgi:acyl carrier protein
MIPDEWVNAVILSAILLGIVIVFLLAYRCVRADAVRQAKKMDAAFADRIPLTTEQFYRQFFKDSDASFATVSGVLETLKELFSEVDLSRLSADDDFSGNIAFLWDYDSLADVELICALEQRFGIKITDDEAKAVRTVSDLMLLVAAKVLTQQSPNANILQ